MCVVRFTLRNEDGEDGLEDAADLTAILESSTRRGHSLHHCITAWGAAQAPGPINIKTLHVTGTVIINPGSVVLNCAPPRQGEKNEIDTRILLRP